MKTMLNQILRGLMRKSDVIGKVHTGTKLVDTVSSKTTTKVASVTVPAGSYIVLGNVAYNVSESVLTICSINESNKQMAVVRGTMDAGGGDCVSCVVDTTKNAEITLNAYHASSSTVPIAIANLNVIRIK